MRPPRRAGEGPLCQGWGGSLPTESSKWRAKEPLTAPLSSRPPSVKRTLNQNPPFVCHRAVGIPLYHQVGSMGWRVMTNPDIPKLETPCGHSAPSSINGASWSSKSKAAQKLGERRADGGEELSQGEQRRSRRSLLDNLQLPIQGRSYLSKIHAFGDSMCIFSSTLVNLTETFISFMYII